MGNKLTVEHHLLLDNLSNCNYSERQKARQALEPYVDDIVEPLITIALCNKHYQSAEAIKLLRLCKDERRFAVFEQMALSDNVVISQAALQGIATICPLPVTMLIEAMPKLNRLVLPHCIQLLGDYYDETIRQILLDYLQTTEEPVITYTIIGILGNTQDTNLIPLIKPYLNHENHHVRSYTEQALNNLTMSK